MATITISPEDLGSGVARIHWPAEARAKVCEMAGAPWADRDKDATLSPLQREILGHDEREKIVHGGSGVGKSVTGGCEMLIEALTPGTNAAVVAWRYDHVANEWEYLDKGIRELFRGHPQVFKRIAFRHSQNYHDYEIDTVWGAKARGYTVSEDEGACLLGKEFTLIVLGEGSHVPADIINTKAWRALDRARMGASSPGRNGRITSFTTPKEFQGYSATKWEDIRREHRGDCSALELGKVPWELTAWMRECAVNENPSYDTRAMDAAKSRLSADVYAEQYLGKMTNRSGRVYDEFDETVHVVPHPTAEQIRRMRLGIGFDTGAYSACTLAGVDFEGRTWILGEVYTEKVSIDPFCHQVEAMLVDVLGEATGADAYEQVKHRVTMHTVDPASQHKMEINEKLGISLTLPARIYGKFDREATIDQVRGMFAMRTLFISERCTYHLDQLRKYVWLEKRSPATKEKFAREPRKEYDHCMDSMRFIVIPLAHEGALGVEPVPESLADAFNSQRRNRAWGPLREIMAAAERKGGVAC